MSIDQKVHKRDLYEKQWQSRDFEISHLWQRSVFLATSIVLSFTAYVKIYGVYFSKDYNLSIFTVFVVQNLICIFGFCFAVLWVCMARGSKYIYEGHEGGINDSHERGFFDNDLDIEIKKERYEDMVSGGTAQTVPRHGYLPLKDYNYESFSLKGSRFSSSKINIFMGNVFSYAWICLIILNVFLLNESLFDEYKIWPFKSVFLLYLCVAFIWFSGNFFVKTGAILAVVIIFFNYYSLTLIFFWIFPISMILFFSYFGISYRVLSDNKMGFFSYIGMVLISDLKDYDPEKNQIEWVVAFLRNSDGKYAYNNVRKNIQKYLESTDSPIKAKMCDDFIFNPSRGSVSRLLSDSALENIFNRSLMARNVIPDSFLGDWIDDNNITRVKIRNPQTIDFLLDGIFYSFSISPEAEPCLFAETDWKRIRRGDNCKNRIPDAKIIHIVEKEKNDSEFYCTLTLDDDNDNKMNVFIMISTHVDCYSSHRSRKDNDFTFSFVLRKNKK